MSPPTRRKQVVDGGDWRRLRRHGDGDEDGHGHGHGENAVILAHARTQGLATAACNQHVAPQRALRHPGTQPTSTNHNTPRRCNWWFRPVRTENEYGIRVCERVRERGAGPREREREQTALNLAGLRFEFWFVKIRPPIPRSSSRPEGNSRATPARTLVHSRRWSSRPGRACRATDPRG